MTYRLTCTVNWRDRYHVIGVDWGSLNFNYVRSLEERIIALQPQYIDAYCPHLWPKLHHNNIEKLVNGLHMICTCTCIAHCIPSSIFATFTTLLSVPYKATLHQTHPEGSHTHMCDHSTLVLLSLVYYPSWLHPHIHPHTQTIIAQHFNTAFTNNTTNAHNSVLNHHWVPVHKIINFYAYTCVCMTFIWDTFRVGVCGLLNTC